MLSFALLAFQHATRLMLSEHYLWEDKRLAKVVQLVIVSTVCVITCKATCVRLIRDGRDTEASFTLVKCTVSIHCVQACVK